MSAPLKEIHTQKLDRLKRRSDFLAVAAHGQKWVSKSLILQMLPVEAPKSRFGLTVTKKVSTKAVERNRIRRRLRALAVDILPKSTRLHADYVLIGRLETLTASYEEIRKDFLWCLKRLNALLES